MEEEIKDAILTGELEDPILAILLEVTINSITTGRPVFENPLVEPDFYRKKFTRWVKEGLDERRQEEKARLEDGSAASHSLL